MINGTRCLLEILGGYGWESLPLVSPPDLVPPVVFCRVQRSVSRRDEYFRGPHALFDHGSW